MIFDNEKLSILEKLVRECGEYMKSATLREDDNNCVKAKSGDADFVTVYDEGVQKRLIEGILEIFPEAHFFAEEKQNFEEDTRCGLCFVIDPIDGTTNFIHNLNASAISIGLLEDGIPVFGLIYDPYREELFTACKGNGAYCNGKRINVSTRSLADSVISFGTTPYKKKEYSDMGFDIAKRLFVNCADIRRSGSAAIDMANVACGKLDAFFECILSPWDFAAGSVIVREAGGAVTDFSGTDVSFSAPCSLFCSNNLVKDEILAIINN